jgi:hypothetical protein
MKTLRFCNRQCVLNSIVLLLLLANPQFIFPQSPASNSQNDKQIVDGILANAIWFVSVDGEKSWQRVTVPGAIEDQIDPAFDGVSVYKTRLPRFGIPEGKLLLLHFDAIATHATVFFNGQEVGQHLGGWTPFEFDVTELARNYKSKQFEIKVKCDELVGHNTQGFLPIIAPHFGGIWKRCNFEIVPQLHINRTKSFVFGDPDNSTLEFEIHLRGWNSKRTADLVIEMPARDSAAFKEEFKRKDKKLESPSFKKRRRQFRIGASYGPTTVPIINSVIKFNMADYLVTNWSPDNPHLEKFKVSVIDQTNREQKTVSSVVHQIAYRSVKANNDQILLNGKPIQVRGLLNWGYAPPSVAPSLDEKFMRREIQFAKDRGFNLMKFCLWIPPKRYLELCDEMGMLAWIEYPTWHAKLTPEHLDDLRREYDEFFCYVRPHPSVILHSLTCETGPSADLKVIQELYDLCKKRIPGSIVEDDSSWISWNRVHDFYDDHPYGNNHTWVATLDRLKKHIAQRQAKPLILGEAIAADTWLNPLEYARAKTKPPKHVQPWSLQAAADYKLLRQIAAANGQTLERLHQSQHEQSRIYAMLMRKYQIETYRREVPTGGYVVSVIRDFPKASMGLIDYLGRPKSKPADWKWHRDLMLLMKTENDRRSFDENEPINLKLIVSNRSSNVYKNAELQIELKNANDPTAAPIQIIKKTVKQVSADKNHIETDIVFESQTKLAAPQSLIVHAKLVNKQKHSPTLIAENHWTIWQFPQADLPVDTRIAASDSIRKKLAGIGIESSARDDSTKSRLQIVNRMTPSLLEYINQGANVILLPDNTPGSSPTTPHWFLRGSPIVAPAFERIVARSQADKQPIFDTKLMVNHLQHFDLAADVVPNIHYLADIEPWIMLWDNHDLREIRTHGLVYKTPLGKGTLVVSALDHFSKTNAAGQYLLRQFIRQQSKPNEKKHASADRNYAALKQELNENSIDLARRDWKFIPDPENTGYKNSFHKSNFNDAAWKTIRIDRHWESQGYRSLDGWAWYRIAVKLPDDWKGGKSFLNFTGVDDHYRLYVQDKLIGTDGIIETKETAFENRKSWDISEYASAGKTINIAIAVYDWFGAGGIFRPVSITNSPLSKKPPILKK